jgi:hypothetical protein
MYIGWRVALLTQSSVEVAMARPVLLAFALAAAALLLLAPQLTRATTFAQANAYINVTVVDSDTNATLATGRALRATRVGDGNATWVLALAGNFSRYEVTVLLSSPTHDGIGGRLNARQRVPQSVLVAMLPHTTRFSGEYIPPFTATISTGGFVRTVSAASGLTTLYFNMSMTALSPDSLACAGSRGPMARADLRSDASGNATCFLTNTTYYQLFEDETYWTLGGVRCASTDGFVAIDVRLDDDPDFFSPRGAVVSRQAEFRLRYPTATTDTGCDVGDPTAFDGIEVSGFTFIFNNASSSRGRFRIQHDALEAGTYALTTIEWPPVVDDTTALHTALSDVDEPFVRFSVGGRTVTPSVNVGANDDPDRALVFSWRAPGLVDPAPLCPGLLLNGSSESATYIVPLLGAEWDSVSNPDGMAGSDPAVIFVNDTVRAARAAALEADSEECPIEMYVLPPMQTDVYTKFQMPVTVYRTGVRRPRTSVAATVTNDELGLFYPGDGFGYAGAIFLPGLVCGAGTYMTEDTPVRAPGNNTDWFGIEEELTDGMHPSDLLVATCNPHACAPSVDDCASVPVDVVCEGCGEYRVTFSVHGPCYATESCDNPTYAVFVRERDASVVDWWIADSGHPSEDPINLRYHVFAETEVEMPGPLHDIVTFRSNGSGTEFGMGSGSIGRAAVRRQARDLAPDPSSTDIVSTTFVFQPGYLLMGVTDPEFVALLVNGSSDAGAWLEEEFEFESPEDLQAAQETISESVAAAQNQSVYASSCGPGQYGRGCLMDCNCVNGVCSEGIDGDGSCNCTAGWNGTRCDIAVSTPTTPAPTTAAPTTAAPTTAAPTTAAPTTAAPTTAAPTTAAPTTAAPTTAAPTTAAPTTAAPTTAAPTTAVPASGLSTASIVIISVAGTAAVLGVSLVGVIMRTTNAAMKAVETLPYGGGDVEMTTRVQGLPYAEVSGDFTIPHSGVVRGYMSSGGRVISVTQKANERVQNSRIFRVFQ